jgi:hypothetical protein
MERLNGEVTDREKTRRGLRNPILRIFLAIKYFLTISDHMKV